MRALKALVTVLAVVAGILSVPSAAAAAGLVHSTSSLSMVGPTGQAREWSALAGDQIEILSPTTESFHLRAEAPDGSYQDVTIRAPFGERLTLGTYEGASSSSWGVGSDDPYIAMASDGTWQEGTGRFTIHDLPEDPSGSSYWFTFDFSNRNGRWFGEGRYRVRTTGAELLVTPGQVSWPDEYPGRTAEVAPVTLTAQGSAPVVVEDVAVTAGATEFSVESTDCTVLDPGESCRVRLGFTPTSPGLRTGTVTIRDSTSSGVHTVSVKGRGVPGTTSWTLDSPPNDGVGGDGRGVLTPDDYLMSASVTPTSLGFAFETRPGVTAPTDFDYGDALFRTDPEHPFEAGQTYTVADPTYADPYAMPKMSVTLNSIRCNRVYGVFTVVEVNYAHGLLQSAEVDFEQQCTDTQGTLTGTIKWRADQVPSNPPPGDVTAPEPVTGLQAVATSTDPFLLTWEDTTSTDWADVVVRGAAGSTPPGTPEEGYAVYRGRLPQARVNDLAMVGEHSFSVFTRDLVGNVGGAATITVPDMVPPDPVSGLRIDVHGDEAHLSWTAPTAPDFDHAFVRARRWPDDPSGGQVIQVGQATSATVPGVDGDTRWRLEVFTVDESGNVDRGTSVMAERTYATWTRSPSSLTCGEEVVLEGDLSDVYETWAKFYAPVVLQSRAPGENWVDTAERTTGLYGGYRFPVSPCTATEYRIRYDGERHHLATVSEPVTLRVAPRIGLTASPSEAPRGTRFVLTAKVAPAQEGLTTKLQRLRSSGWSTVATKPLADTGRVRFAVRPASRGKLTYRVVTPRTDLLLRGTSAKRTLTVT